jgi:F-type H+-transporting ATPase subunit a
MDIFIEAEKIFHIGPFAVTNTYLTSVLVVIIISVGAYLFSRRISETPGRLQHGVEMLLEFLFDFFEKVFGDKERTRKFFPFVCTFFLFILLSNWFGIFPGVGTIGLYEEHNGRTILVPFLRSVNSDINMTLALAVISVLATNIIGIAMIGFFKYASRYINFHGPINFFVGILELISEVAKIISFSFRLFGNIFAGEVLLIVMAFLLPFIVPLPFLAMELFVGFVQALVFSMLTVVFLKTATEHVQH